MRYIPLSALRRPTRESRISDDSPFGRAMIGKHIGETVEVEAPVGIVKFEILSVER